MNFKYLITYMMVILFFVSCDTGQDTEKPMDPYSKPVATYTVTSFQDTTQEADEFTYVFDITIDRPLREDLPFRAYQVGGTADSSDFIAIDGVIAAYTTSTQVKVKIVKDFVPEPDETLVLRVAPFNSESSHAWDAEHWAHLLSPSSPKEEVSINIINYASDDLVVDLSWKVNVDNEDDCSQDLDLYLMDATDTEVAHSWFDCPESVTLLGTVPDGDYFIDVDYWAPSTVAVDPAVDPIYNTKYTLTLTQPGVFSESYGNSFDDSDTTNYYLNWSGYAQFGGNGYHAHVVQITKSGTNYTVTEL